MKISIVTPSFNQGHFIGETIESVIAQKGDFEIEYIVMDGGSTDDTVKILKQYEQRVKGGEFKGGNRGVRFFWSSKKDKGQSDAINKGLKRATGDILAYINSDDIYLDGVFAKVVSGFRKNSKRVWLTGKCKIINEDSKEIRKGITAYKNFFLKRYSYKKLLVLNFISQPATFWRKTATDKIALFNEKEHLVMDYEYWLKLGKLSDIIYLNEYLAGFRSYAQNKSTLRFSEQFADEYRVASQNTKSWPLIAAHKVHAKAICAAYKILS